VNGANTHPIFNMLKHSSKIESISWNFEKFLITPQGKVVLHGTAKQLKPKDFEKEIVKIV
jgi:glutathione peroxidase-family protein